jgi:hypothetical protein
MEYNRSMRNLILAASLALASLFIGAEAQATCPSINPNALAPPFYDGCPLLAAGLNNIAINGPNTRNYTWSGSGTGSYATGPLWQVYTLSGTSTAGSGFQLSGTGIFDNADNLIAPQPIYAYSQFDVEDTLGATAQGARNVIKAFATVQTTPTVPGSPGGNYPAYVGVFPGGRINVNLGGTGTTTATAAGSLYGMNPNVTLGANATDQYVVTDQENDMTVLSGASVAQKIGIDVVEASTDAVQGSVVDAAFMLFNQPGAVGWECGICYGGNGSGGAFPIKSNGTMIGTIGSSGMSATNGVDLSSVTFSGDAFKSNFFSVSGTGSLIADNIAPLGHILPITGVTPTAPSFSCGSGCTAVGSDTDGKITPSSAVSAATITFAFTWGTAPVCVATGIGTSGGVIVITAISATAVTFTNNSGDFSGSDGFNYICMN